MSKTVYLHVGTAKSGTTYLQRMLFRNRGLLRENGVLCPGGRPRSHFLASVDLRKRGFKGHEYAAATGAWNRLVDEAQAFPGSTLISHETLALTPPALVDQAVDSFSGSDVRVILTCRDLGRQIPAAWQERIKNWHEDTYDTFLRQLFDSWNSTQAPRSGVFWPLQDLTELTQRWSRAVGAENVRLVTVPGPGADRAELWRRFAGAADLPDLDYAVDIPASNPSLGIVETELLRRLNPNFPEDLTWPQYETRIKGRFVPRELSVHNTRGNLSVPEKWHESTREAASQMIGFLSDSGSTVVGDLEDLRPVFGPEGSLAGEVGSAELLDLALQVLASTAAASQTPTSGREAGRIIARKLKGRLRRDR